MSWCPGLVRHPPGASGTNEESDEARAGGPGGGGRAWEAALPLDTGNMLRAKAAIGRSTPQSFKAPGAGLRNPFGAAPSPRVASSSLGGGPGEGVGGSAGPGRAGAEPGRAGAEPPPNHRVRAELPV